MRRPFFQKFKQITPAQFIVLSYLVTIVVSTGLLLLPISQQPGVRLHPFDALFTATSAVSVTGLTTVSVPQTFSTFGIVMIMGMIHFGGIGIMALGTFIWILLGQNISLSYRRLIMLDQNRTQLSGLVHLMRSILVLALIFELVGALVFGTYFMAAGYYDDWVKAFYHGLFHSISAYTNAGLDLFGNSMYSFSGDYFVQFVTMVLLVLGAIGFPVLIEVREKLFGRDKQFKFSLFTKLTVTTFVLLMILGTTGIWIVESSVYFQNMSWHEKFFYSLFNSISTRSGGLATMDVADFTTPTQFLLSILMFIGASPSSVGGGIRTTTLAVIMLTLATYAVGRTDVRVFRRTIRQEDITKSFVVFSTAVMIVIGATMFLDAVERQHFALNKIIFEVCSAFGTSGLSTGITGSLTGTGKMILILLMFIGRIGILCLLFFFRTKVSKDRYHYPKEELIIG
ncbi:TrkH family potassium uptake protein [Paenibacillus sp. GD4]|uniref:TrkH family potassium uptake protein n=1 Tax=Paenibacillus sp. GD4 TaxID=3068890 RepID=UPI002796A203|nr:TrkH family potassium uptake protein [Paenibacillus sp. GD4]MDQ1909266.1 TrkH family potassium uptake protein [Paenibacillus sp. GD4]